MTTSNDPPKGNSQPASGGRTLKPSNFGTQNYGPGRVYPVRKPDDYGQVGTSDVDLSKDGQSPAAIDPAHYRTDTDVSALSLHHTLGSGFAQAAPGDHQHNGSSSAKLGEMIFNPAFNPSLPPGPGNEKFIPKYTVTDLATLLTFLHTFCNFT